ncbi:AGAP007803-PA-like protein [Anopheles sinensis]|uniref:AGAP007803-PA-like protein n=1 Tax=Anopheles sinensis TaxID=74873 RepID=A0A084WQD7_ANOSI|nr:AGAP007803-PA-like protein [Anopheles sinensis]
MDFLRQQQQQQQDLMALQGNFAEMALGKDPIMAASAGGGVFAPPLVQPPQHMPGAAHLGAGSVAPGNVVVSGGSTSQQSRLNQWKLPSLEKDPSAGKDDLTDFSRAPGPTATAGAKSSTTSANLSSLGLVQDGTWATGRTNLTDGGWPEQTGETESKDWSTTNNNTSSQDSSAFTDLVPEFEPGKPWKGTQLKIEDDPSITPGSVARSPLSISTAKESELFGGGGGGAGGMAAPEKVSPTVAAGDGRSGGLNLTSSAWSFNTPSSTAVASGGKAWTDSTAGGGAAVTSAAADVWCTPIGKPSATRGPPPGLGGAASKGGNGGGGVSWSTGSQRGSSWGVGTSWLLLKNLTSQIDASTLRTLCMQHGPIVSFHSYPTHGLALCRYNTREEATTAQQALNNCPLGTGTISAECPGSESEVQTYLQQLGGSGGGGGGGGANTVAVSSSTAGSISSISSQSWRQRGSTGAGADTWGSGWPLGGGAGANAGSGSGAANLWAPLDTADPGTPSSLNSFLPESLLGPELN